MNDKPIPSNFDDGPPASHSRHLVFSQRLNANYETDVRAGSCTESLEQGKEYLTLKFPQSCDPKTILNLLAKMALAVQDSCNQTWKGNL